MVDMSSLFFLMLSVRFEIKIVVKTNAYLNARFNSVYWHVSVVEKKTYLISRPWFPQAT